MRNKFQFLRLTYFSRKYENRNFFCSRFEIGKDIKLSFSTFGGSICRESQFSWVTGEIYLIWKHFVGYRRLRLIVTRKSNFVGSEYSAVRLWTIGYGKLN